MSSIEASVSERLAISLFDQAIVPLAMARRSANAPACLPRDHERAAASYFSEPALRVMEAVDFEFPGGGTAEGLIEHVVDHWKRSGEADLCVLEPAMREIALALHEEADKGDGSVNIFCYAMF